MIFDGKTEVVDTRGEGEGVDGVVGVYVVRIARETKALQVREVEVARVPPSRNTNKVLVNVGSSVRQPPWQCQYAYDRPI
jgi:hypothetical protein